MRILRPLFRGSFARDIGGTLVATLVTMFAAGFQAVLVARCLGPSGKGAVTAVLLLSGTLSPLLDSGFAASATYFATRAAPSKSIGNAARFSVYATTVALLVVFVLKATGVLGDVLPSVHGSVLAVGCFLIPIAIGQSVLGNLLIGLGGLRTLNLIRGATSIGALGASAIALWLGGETIAICAISLATSFLGLVAVWNAIRKDNPGVAPEFDIALFRRQLTYAAKDHIGAVVQFLNYRLDQLLISGFVGTRGLGLYTVAVTLAELLWLVPNSAATVIFPRVSSRQASSQRQTTAITALISLVLGVLGALALALFGEPAIRALFSGEFESAYTALVRLLPGAVMLGPAKILTADLAGRGYPLVNSACSVLGLVLTLSVGFALIPDHGIDGAAITSTVSYASVAVLALGAFLLLTNDRTSALTD